MHEYLPVQNLSYRSCTNCSKRTPHTCIRCGSCYSCHPMSRSAGTQMLLVA
ncbi:MAG TPA: hypothetical protein VFT58_01050 [Nitrososphaera sp.]|nr:hypothetical protein [Nitrososphaera sp.]